MSANNEGLPPYQEDEFPTEPLPIPQPQPDPETPRALRRAAARARRAAVKGVERTRDFAGRPEVRRVAAAAGRGAVEGAAGAVGVNLEAGGKLRKIRAARLVGKAATNPWGAVTRVARGAAAGATRRGYREFRQIAREVQAAAEAPTAPLPIPEQRRTGRPDIPYRQGDPDPYADPSTVRARSAEVNDNAGAHELPPAGELPPMPPSAQTPDYTDLPPQSWPPRQ